MGFLTHSMTEQWIICRIYFFFLWMMTLKWGRMCAGLWWCWWKWDLTDSSLTSTALLRCLLCQSPDNHVFKNYKSFAISKISKTIRLPSIEQLIDCCHNYKPMLKIPSLKDKNFINSTCWWGLKIQMGLWHLRLVSFGFHSLSKIFARRFDGYLLYPHIHISFIKLIAKKNRPHFW